MERKQTFTFLNHSCFRTPKGTCAHRSQRSLKSTSCRERTNNMTPRSWLAWYTFETLNHNNLGLKKSKFPHLCTAEPQLWQLASLAHAGLTCSGNTGTSFSDSTPVFCAAGRRDSFKLNTKNKHRKQRWWEGLWKQNPTFWPFVATLPAQHCPHTQPR